MRSKCRRRILKQGWLRRNGLPESDQATLVEFFVRHGDRLTHTSVITDPVYLAEPEIRTTDFFRQPVDHQSWLFPCDDSEQIAGRAPDSVPNYLFGENPFVKEQGDRYHIPAAAYLGGPETAYPEFISRIPKLTDADGLAKLRPSSSTERQSRASDPTPRDGEIHVWRIRDSVYLLAGDDGNIVAQVGDEGAFVVDPGSGRLAEKILTEIRRLSDKPIQFIANTSFRPEHTGGNVKLRASGADPSVRGSFFSLQFADAGVGATIMAHQNVQTRMVASKAPPDGVPSDTYLEERRRTFHNGDAIEMFWEPHAVTDGDSIVRFRRADVIVAGDVFTTTQYPMIDLQNGGSGAGRNQGAERHSRPDRVPARRRGRHHRRPGHGYLCDEHEVVEYRDMVVIVRDRIAGDAQERRDARPGQGREADRRLRHALRRDVGPVDDRHVRRSGLPGPVETKVVREGQ